MSKKDYGKWTIKQLTIELKKRKAKSSGKKADLVQRLKDYAGLFIQAHDEEEEQFVFCAPSAEHFKDINSSHNLLIDINFYEKFLRSVGNQMNIEKGKKMYIESYLLSLRKAFVNNETYLCARVASEYRKSVQYTIYIKINQIHCISETECECAAGKGPLSSCKHVSVTIMAIKDFIEKKVIISRQTCTEKLQTFHQTKKYTGSPIKAKHLKLQTKEILQKKLVDFDPRPAEYIKKPEYYSYFRNKCLTFSGTFKNNFPELQLFGPANLIALHNDHDYLELHAEDLFLKEMNITHISLDKVLEIEKSIRGQSANKLWLHERSKRINSSSFGKVLSSTNHKETDKKLINPSDLSHIPAIIHGKMYESHAIKQFEMWGNVSVNLCGTFVSVDHPYLAASPDGILNDKTCIEVKCPFSAKDNIISPETVDYIYLCKKGVYKLKENHNYYCQVQGQLYCAQKEICVFIIYTFKDFLLLKISRNEDFIKTMIDSLQTFFDKYYKSEILLKYFYKYNEC